ncbi:ECF-type sigma factor [Ideonella sp. DXS29W]|uniref:ECF-type sigma factor n=1 Tax=Ideonella lacteola TaxID=2984193 RepID=A0ABU9BHZ9_9BURK
MSVTDAAAHADAEPDADPVLREGSHPVDEFFLASYRELRRLAHSRLHGNNNLTLLDTTSLVHECYLRLSHGELPAFERPGDILAYSARVMRSVVVDFARRRLAERRGGGSVHMSLQADDLPCGAPGASEEQILEVDEALSLLAEAEPRLAQVVEMKYFGGFTEAEIADTLGVVERTVRRDWEKARALLRVALGR